MTEAEWLGCTEPQKMLEFLAEGTAGVGQWWFLSCGCCRTDCARRGGPCPAYRKLRLLACACCRRVLPLLPDPVCLHAVEAAEQYADGLAGEGASDEAAVAFDQRRRGRFPKDRTPDDGAWNAVYCAVHRRWGSYIDEGYARERWRLTTTAARDAAESAGAGEPVVQAALLRDVLGNPFRPVTLDPSWLTPDVVSLALAAYDHRSLPACTLDPERLGLLADALEDVGCTNEDLLGHLRSDAPHVRGCFGVDLVLGKG